MADALQSVSARALEIWFVWPLADLSLNAVLCGVMCIVIECKSSKSKCRSVLMERQMHILCIPYIGLAARLRSNYLCWLVWGQRIDECGCNWAQCAEEKEQQIVKMANREGENVIDVAMHRTARRAMYTSNTTYIWLTRVLSEIVLSFPVVENKEEEEKTMTDCMHRFGQPSPIYYFYPFIHLSLMNVNHVNWTHTRNCFSLARIILHSSTEVIHVSFRIYLLFEIFFSISLFCFSLLLPLAALEKARNSYYWKQHNTGRNLCTQFIAHAQVSDL